MLAGETAARVHVLAARVRGETLRELRGPTLQGV